MSFVPYIARDRVFQNFQFDFHIVNETGKSWYDGSPNQWMPEREWCVSKIRPGMTIVDCGAHHGMMSLIFAHWIGPTGLVIAYEALSSNASVVIENAKLNNLQNIIVRPVGVGDTNSSMQINHNLSNIMVIQDSSDQKKDSDEVVNIVRLDDDLPIATKVDLIKIDVEGHDLYALHGMSRILKQRPIIDLELHNFLFEDRLSTLTQIVALLKPLGYSWEMLGEIFDKPIDIGTDLDVPQLASFDNPHLLGSIR